MQAVAEISADNPNFHAALVQTIAARQTPPGEPAGSNHGSHIMRKLVQGGLDSFNTTNVGSVESTQNSVASLFERNFKPEQLSVRMSFGDTADNEALVLVARHLYRPRFSEFVVSSCVKSAWPEHAHDNIDLLRISVEATPTHTAFELPQVDSRSATRAVIIQFSLDAFQIYKYRLRPLEICAFLYRLRAVCRIWWESELVVWVQLDMVHDPRLLGQFDRIAFLDSENRALFLVQNMHMCALPSAIGATVDTQKKTITVQGPVLRDIMELDYIPAKVKATVFTTDFHVYEEYFGPFLTQRLMADVYREITGDTSSNKSIQLIVATLCHSGIFRKNNSLDLLEESNSLVDNISYRDVNLRLKNRVYRGIKSPVVTISDHIVAVLEPPVGASFPQNKRLQVVPNPAYTNSPIVNPRAVALVCTVFLLPAAGIVRPIVEHRKVYIPLANLLHNPARAVRTIETLAAKTTSTFITLNVDICPPAVGFTAQLLLRDPDGNVVDGLEAEKQDLPGGRAVPLSLKIISTRVHRDSRKTVDLCQSTLVLVSICDVQWTFKFGLVSRRL